MKKINVRQVTLAALTCFCFWVAGERIHDFWKINIPLGFAGECFMIHYPGTKDNYQMRILENNNEEKGSLVSISLLEPKNDSWMEQFTYVQQRMLSPKKMECQ